MSLDGFVYMVCLLEIPSREIFVDSNGAVTWPRLGPDSSLNIDGLLVLHDATQPAIFPETIHLLSSSQYSALLRAVFKFLTIYRFFGRVSGAVHSSCE